MLSPSRPKAMTGRAGVSPGGTVAEKGARRC